MKTVEKALQITGSKMHMMVLIPRLNMFHPESGSGDRVVFAMVVFIVSVCVCVRVLA